MLDDIKLALVDGDDEDQRRILIEADHPELKQAVDEGADEVHRGTEVMRPDLPIAMHDLVTNELWADNPPEMWESAERLAAAGYGRHDVLHITGSAVSGQVWEAMANNVVYDIERVRLELAAVPESWGTQREQWPVALSRDRAARRAQEHRRRQPTR